jgi:hypothetical protein
MWRYHFCRNDRNQLWGDYNVTLDRCVSHCFLILHDQMVTICTTEFNIKEFYVLAPGAFLGAFAILRKATISFVVSVRSSVLPSAWNNPAPTGWIFTEVHIWVFFEKKFRENSSFIKIGKEKCYFTWRPVYIFCHISLISSYNETFIRQYL